MACYSRIVHASLLFGISFCTLTGCQNRANTAELLEANFVASGKTAIDLLSPTQDQQVASAHPTFSWGDRGAGLYTLEIASDANFQNMVLKKSVKDTQYTLANADLSGVSALTTNSYHWRVKIANVSNNLQSKTGTFFLVAMPSGGSGSAGVLYVNTASSSSVEIGSKEKPYKRIQAAIANADALRNYQFGVNEFTSSTEDLLRRGLIDRGEARKLLKNVYKGNPLALPRRIISDLRSDFIRTLDTFSRVPDTIMPPMRRAADKDLTLVERYLRFVPKRQV